MAKFGTQEWYDIYKEEINNSKAYEEAAKTWEGDFLFYYREGRPAQRTHLRVCRSLSWQMPKSRSCYRPQEIQP